MAPEKPAAKMTQDASHRIDRYSGLISGGNDLSLSDIVVFEPGRSKNDLLSDVRWHGTFIGACEHRGTTVVAIGYLIHDDDAIDHAIGADAIFIDEAFQRFVRWESEQQLGNAVPDPEGVYLTVPKPRRLDDCRWLIGHAEQHALTVDDMRNQLSKLVTTNRQVDRGLRELSADEKRNVELRDQFNAGRLSVGMTPEDVRAILKADPLETGKVASGAYAIYGSNEILNIRYPPINDYSNILVYFRDGKASVILPVLIGLGPNYEWRKSLGKLFPELPPPPRMSPLPE